MKILKGLPVIFVAAVMILLPLSSKEKLNAETNTANGFEGIDIVTEDTYQPVNPNISQKLENVPMGSSIPQSKTAMARASAPYWDESNGVKKFYDAKGNLMYHEGTKKIIDVSEHNGEINWEKVKASGVDGAIIRVGWGYLGEDKYFQRNVNECNRLGIPYGIYLYSYAYDANFAYAEANGTAEMLKKVNLNLSYPIYYDIEKFDAWNDNGTTRVPPTSVAEYEKIIATYISRMEQLGYAGRVHVYSYRSYLQNELNSPKIHQYTSWIAAYTPTLGFDNKHYNGEEGWQYTSDGRVDGIKGRVDMNCFSNQFYNIELSATIPDDVKNALASAGARFEKGYVRGLPINTDLTTVSNALSAVGNVTCFNKNGNIVSGGKIGTGQRITIVPNKNNEEKKSYTIMIVVKGDVDGDGQIRSIDYSLVKNDILNLKKLNSGYFIAGDIDGDGKIRSIDYSLIKNDILNLKKIEQ